MALLPEGRKVTWLHRFDCGGEMMAGSYGFAGRDRYYYYLHCVTEGELARQTPGRMLMYELMRICIARGIRQFDFTIGDEDYKSDWCELSEPLFDNSIALGLVAAAPLTGIRAGRFAKRTLKRIPGARNALLGLRMSFFGRDRG